MPAFFIISGMCFDSGKYKNFWNFIKRKFKAMVIPYIGFCIFGFIISYIIPAWRATLFQEYTWKAIFWYTQPETLHVGQVWFLIALFNSSIFFYFIHKYIFSIKNNIAKYISIIATLLILIIIGYNIKQMVNIPYFHRLPFKLDVAFTSTAFMMIGYIIYKLNIIKLICQKKIIIPIALILLAFLNIKLGTKSNGYVNICDCIYGNAYKYYISAICGTMVILLIAYLIKKNSILEYYGRNSLFMFAFHSMYLYLTQFLLTKIYHQPYYIMGNIPPERCLVCAIIIYILLYPTSCIYNLIFKRNKKAV